MINKHYINIKINHLKYKTGLVYAYGNSLSTSMLERENKSVQVYYLDDSMLVLGNINLEKST